MPSTTAASIKAEKKKRTTETQRTQRQESQRKAESFPHGLEAPGKNSMSFSVFLSLCPLCLCGSFCPVTVMDLHPLHVWDLNIPEAIALQKKLAAEVDTQTPLGRCELVAGADVSYNYGSDVFFAVV